MFTLFYAITIKFHVTAAKNNAFNGCMQVRKTVMRAASKILFGSAITATTTDAKQQFRALQRRRRRAVSLLHTTFGGNRDNHESGGGSVTTALADSPGKAAIYEQIENLIRRSYRIIVAFHLTRCRKMTPGRRA